MSEIFTRAQARAEKAARKLERSSAAPRHDKLTRHQAEVAFRQMAQAEFDAKLYGSVPADGSHSINPRRRTNAGKRP